MKMIPGRFGEERRRPGKQLRPEAGKLSQALRQSAEAALRLIAQAKDGQLPAHLGGGAPGRATATHAAVQRLRSSALVRD